ncbi:MAG: di-heme oxidoredictase family protein, partial [Planctomycetota bacterium]
MRRRLFLAPVCSSIASCLLLLAALPSVAEAQYAERPSLVGSGQPDVDASGRSVKNPRVRAVHTEDPSLEGGTAYLIQRDPFLAYQLGRNLNFREFRHRDGALLSNVGGFAGPMVDGTTAKITANNHTSCLGCHNLPSGNPGGGTNFSKDSGLGRNAPHYYGSGLMEMQAIQIRQQILDAVDRDGDGWISGREAAASPANLFVDSAPGGPAIDFGSARLDGGKTGRPMLNSIFRIWFGAVGESGAVEIVPDATAIDGVNATHFNFELVVWGWGQRAPEAALNPTNRVFLWDPFLTHSDLDSHDPSTLDDPDGDGVSEPTLAGAIQFPATHRAPDPGNLLDPLGFSRDDPDGDGVLTEISEGDLDLAEWFMLNVPAPAFAGTEAEYDAGVGQLEALDCTACHVADWQLESAADGFAGDRRLFDLVVEWNEQSERLEGRLERLDEQVGENRLPKREAFLTQGLFTDFRQHDMGTLFAELAFDGNINRRWRTAPLWGVGSGFPWGHDGQSLTLDDVIRRHGGEAQASAAAYAALGADEREALIGFLRKLVLFDLETLPTDMDGDGVIAEDFMVAGRNTGEERFNVEWLFKQPARIQGPVVNT